MSDHQFEPTPAVARTSHLNRAEEAHAPLIPAVQREQVNQSASRTRDGSTAAAHAALISRAAAGKPERVAHFFSSNYRGNMAIAMSSNWLRDPGRMLNRMLSIPR